MTSATDPSQRLILSADAPLLSNLAALWATEPKMAELLEAALELPGLSVEKSKSGPPTVSVRTDDGRALYLHSRYEPAKEAERLIESIAVQQKTTFYLLGLGL